MGFWPVVLDMMRNVDIIVVIGDARMPYESINKELIWKINEMGTPYVIAYSKRDLVSNERISELEKEEAFVVSSPKNLGVSKLRRHLQIMAKKMNFAQPRIGVVGYPNIGKSALINALARRRQAIVSPVPGTTRGVQWVKAGNLKILDSPGVIPFEDKNRKLVLIGAKSSYQVRSPEKHAIDIIEMFLSSDIDKEKLKEFYKLDSLGSDSYETFLEIGKKRKFLRKGGEVDEDRTARTIIREWQIGKLKL